MARAKFQIKEPPLFDTEHESDIRLLIIDCHFIAYRNSFHLPITMCNEEGFPTFGIKGFLQGFHNEIRRFNPTHVVCAFDGQSKNRMEISEGSYKKGQRTETKTKDAETVRRHSLMGRQFKHMRRIVAAMGYAVFHNPDEEADDLIGTLAVAYPEANVVVLSRDKDFNVLVRRGVRIVDTTGKQIIIKDTAYVKERYGVHPKHFSKYLALVGDKVDNVGKVVGVGPVTAAKWLKTHSGSLQAVLTHEVKKKKDRNIIRLGYKLTKINKNACEAPPIHKLKKRKGDPDELKRLLDKFEINKRRTL